MEEENGIKKVIKTLIKKKLIKVAILIGIIIGIVVLLAGSFYVKEKKDTLEDTSRKDKTNASAAARTHMNNTIIGDDGKIYTNESVQSLWDRLVKDKNTITKYLNTPEELAKLLNAALATQYLDTRKNPDKAINWNKNNKKVESTAVQGIVKLKRKSDTGEEITMSYVKPEKFEELISKYKETGSEEDKKEALKHFTLEKTNSSYGGTADFIKYELSEQQLLGLAAVAYSEQGSLGGAAAEASLMANLFELKSNGTCNGKTGGDGLYEYVSQPVPPGWFQDACNYINTGHLASYAGGGPVPKEAIDVVRKVLCEGKRTLPGYIDEHDSWLGKDYSASNDGTDITSNRSSYIQYKTHIDNNYDSHYTFWGWGNPEDPNSDPFGYISEENRQKIGEAHYEYSETGEWKLIGGTGGSGSTVRGAYKSATQITPRQLVEAGTAVMKRAYDSLTTNVPTIYWDSKTLPPCEAQGYINGMYDKNEESDLLDLKIGKKVKMISCDRLIARALWDLGFTDQSNGGEAINSFSGGWLEEHGFVKSYSIDDIGYGSIVLVNRCDNGTWGHALLSADKYDGGDTLYRLDAGSNTKIQTKQPYAFSWYYGTDVEVYNIPGYVGKSPKELGIKKGTETGTRNVTLEGNELEVYKILSKGVDYKGKHIDGLSDIQIAGIFGNIANEDSTFDPAARESSNPTSGHGLIQWSGAGRINGLMNYAKEKGKTWDDLKTQAEYILVELFGDDVGYWNGGEKDRQAFLSATTPREAAKIFLVSTEIGQPYSEATYPQIKAKYCMNYGNGDDGEGGHGGSGQYNYNFDFKLRYEKADEYFSKMGGILSDSGGNGESTYVAKVAKWSEHEVIVETDDPNETSYDTKSYSMDVEIIEYQKYVSKYSIPFNYLWSMLVISQDKEFTFALADLIYNSKFEITIHDNVKETISENVENYSRQYRIPVSTQVTPSVNIGNQNSIQEVTVTKNYYKKTTTIDIKDTLEIALTKADTWCVDYNVDYEPHEDPAIIDPGTEESLEDTEESTHDVSSDSDRELAEDAQKKIQSNYTNITSSGGKVSTKSDKYYTSKKNIKTKTKTSNKIKIKYMAGETKVYEKVDEENAPNFVTLLKSHYKARNNILSVKSWLFEILSSNDDTKDMVDLTKYLLYKATNVNYGVKIYDFSPYDPENFIPLDDKLYGETNEEKIWFALRNAGFSEYASAAAMGNLSVDSNLRSNNLEDQFERRFIKDVKNIKNIKEEINTSDTTYTSLVNAGTYQKKQFAKDGAGYGLAMWKTELRKQRLYEYTKDQNVGIDDLKAQIEYMIGELTGDGPAKEFAIQIKQGKVKTEGIFAKKEDWENANNLRDATIAFMRFYIRPDVLTTADERIKATEKYYDLFKGREAPDSGSNSVAGDFLAAAKKVHDEERGWHYYATSDASDLYFGDIESSLNNPNKATCCATYVGCVIYEAGYATKEQMNECDYNSPEGLYSYFKEKGWQEIMSYDDLQPGDVVFMYGGSSAGGGKRDYGHVQIYAGDGTWFNAGGNDAIHNPAPYASDARGRFNSALRPKPIK